MATKTKADVPLFDQIKAAMQAFEKLQRSYAKYGAGDTEPDGEFHDIVARAFKGKPVSTDLSAGEWQLYSDERGVGLAASNMNRAAAKVVALIGKVPTAERAAVGKYLAGICWRADFGDD